MHLVDIHCHVFNGRDIPLKEFLYFGRDVPWGLAYFIEWLVRNPSGSPDLAKQAAIFKGGTQQDFQQAEDRNLIDRFVAYADLLRRTEREITAELIDEYSPYGVELYTPAITDMDCWLGDATFYADRVKNHADLAKDKDFKGLVHPIIGFDPVRQHATRTAFGQGNDHLAQVQLAVEQQGFVGVKVYPPMGYRPVRNAWLYPSQQQVSRPNLGPVRCKLAPNEDSQPVPMTGVDLDQAMLQLFDYCITADVPVMVHCTPHGAEAKKYRGFNSDPRHWKALLEMNGGRFKNLRLNLAHFGGDGDRPSFVQRCFDLVTTFPNVYGDVGAHDLVWGTNDNDIRYGYDLMSALEEGQDWTRKIMLGTDWHTIYVDPSPRVYIERYLHYFDDLSMQIDQRSAEIGQQLSADSDAVRRLNFRGLTALRFLGLDDPQSKPRKRLEAFYKANNLFTLQGNDKPAWW